MVENRIHERVRGGYRLAKSLTRGMNSVPIEIVDHGLLYVNLQQLDQLSLSLYFSSPIKELPHEPEMTALFSRLIRSSDTVFDVGANLGLHTLTFAKIARQVIAFEPNPALTPNLRKTVAGLPNAQLVESCLSEQDGTVEFHISDWDHMLGSMANWTDQPVKSMTIPSRSIDSLITEGMVPQPDVLKVDVEGAELLVFRGADKLLSGPNAPRAIVFEELNTASRKLGISDGAPADYLKARGYSLFLIEKENLTPLPLERPFAANLVALKENNSN